MGNAGTVTIDVDAATAKLEAGMDRATRKVAADTQKMQAQAVATGAAIGTAIGNGVGKAIDALSTMVARGVRELSSFSQVSQQFGISTEALSALRREATLFGSDFGEVEKALAKVSTAASTNNGVFKAMGLTVTDSNGKLKSSEQLLLDVATKFSGYQDSAAKAALAQRLFGQEGSQLIPMLDDIGRRGLPAVIEQARQAGALFGGDTSNAAKQFTNDLNKLRTGADDFGLQLAQSLLPALDKAVSLLDDPSFNKALQGIAEAIGEIAEKAVETTKALADMYNKARGGVDVELGGNITNQAGRDIAQQQLDALMAKRQSGGTWDLLKQLNSAASPSNPDMGKIVATTRALFSGSGEDNAAQIADLQQRIAAYDKSRPNFSGVVGSVGDTYADPKAAAPMLPQSNSNNSLMSAVKQQSDAARQLQTLIEQLQGQVAGPATQAWDAYAKSVRQAADDGAKQIEAAQKQVALGDKTISVAKVTAQVQDQVAVAVKAAGAVFDDYQRKADKAFNDELANVNASASGATKATTQIAEATRQYEKSIESLDDRLRLHTITQAQYNMGSAAYKALLDKQVKDIENASSEINQFELEAARNIQDEVAQTFTDIYTGVNDTAGSILKSWEDMILKMIAQAQAAQLAKALFGDYGKTGEVGGLFGSAIKDYFGGGAASGSGAMAGDQMATINDGMWSGFAKGDAFAGSADLARYSSSVVTHTTPFMFAKGAGFMGEAESEAIVPLARGNDGKLGIRATGGGGGISMPITIINNAQAKVTAKQGQGSDGTPNLTLLIDQIDEEMANRVQTGRSKTARAIGARSGTNMNANV
jgi:lambda family phage tail tape measure protein